MADEPYEIMSHKEIVNLKRQIKDLQYKTQNTPSDKLLNSINNLTEQMNSMIGLFKTAADEMRMEEKDEHFVAKKIEPLIERLDEIIDQNRAIAEGMVAVSDLVKDNIGNNKLTPKHDFFQPKHEEKLDLKPHKPESHLEPPKPEPALKPPLPEPTLNPPPPVFPKFDVPEPMGHEPMDKHTPPMPMPNMAMPTEPPSMPEPFPFEEPKKKKGLFGKFRK